MLHRGPEEEQPPLLFNRHAFHSLPEPVDLAIIFFVSTVVSMSSPLFHIYTVLASTKHLVKIFNIQTLEERCLRYRFAKHAAKSFSEMAQLTSGAVHEAILN